MPQPSRSRGDRELQITGAVPGRVPSGPTDEAARNASRSSAPLPARQRRRPDAGRPAPGGQGRSDLISRVLVAVPAVILAVVFVDLGGVGWMLLMALLALACVSELYRMLADWRPLSLVGFVVVAAMCVVAYYGDAQDALGVAAASLPLVFLGILARGDTERSTLSIAATLLGVMWIGMAFAHGVLLRQSAHGRGLVIDVMVGTFVADTAAYLGGRWFGRHPLAPAISPKKTVEGLFCGGLAAILAVFCAGIYQSWLPHGTALLLGFTIAVLGPIGDLFESLIKRDSGVKDAGTMFGAHGGALDRLDAISFTIIAAYYIWALVPH